MRGTQNISGTGPNHDKGDLIMAGSECIAANVTGTLNPADKIGPDFVGRWGTGT